MVNYILNMISEDANIIYLVYYRKFHKFYYHFVLVKIYANVFVYLLSRLKTQTVMNNKIRINASAQFRVDN